MPPKDFIIPALSAAASFVGAWLAANFALRRFYKERIWDRKAAAYTVIFEALSDMLQWFTENHDAYFAQRDLPDEKKERLLAAYRTAKEQLHRRLAGESWIIPEQCRTRLEKMMIDLEKTHEDYFKYLDESWGIIKDTTDDLRTMIRTDMKTQ